MPKENKIAPGAVRALVWEFIWRLGSATVLVVGVVVVMALSIGGCTTRKAGATPAAPTPELTISIAELAETEAALYETARLAEAASRSMDTLERCRDFFWRAVEQPPAEMASWNQSEHLDYLVTLVQTRDRCEDRALLRLAGQIEL